MQHKFNCQTLTYWFDESRGAAFCLVEMPTREAVKKLHAHSHGMVPGNIIEVNSKLVEAFLGRIKDPDDMDPEATPLGDSVLRTILVLHLNNVAILKHRLGKDTWFELHQSCGEQVEQLARECEGKVADTGYSEWTVRFISAANAIACARKLIQKIPELEPENISLSWNIGISAGEPVTRQNTLFGEAIQLARRFCRTVEQRHIVVSHLVQKLYKKEPYEEMSRLDAVQFLNAESERFFNEFMNLVEEACSDPQLTNSFLIQKLGVSESQLYRKITSITGHTRNELIRNIRLDRAVQLMENREGNIAEIAFETGFNNPSYFSKCFRKRYGILPSS